MTHKQCTRCGDTLPTSCFYKKSGGGIGGQCKACVIEKAKAFRATEKYKQWLEESREQRRIRKEKHRRDKGAKPKPQSTKLQKTLAKTQNHQQHVVEYKKHASEVKKKIGRWRSVTEEQKRKMTDKARLKRNLDRDGAALVYCKRLLAKHSILKASEIPLTLVLAKQAQLQILNFINNGK